MLAHFINTDPIDTMFIFMLVFPILAVAVLIFIKYVLDSLIHDLEALVYWIFGGPKSYSAAHRIVEIRYQDPSEVRDNHDYWSAHRKYLEKTLH